MSSYKAYLISPDGHHIKAVDLDCVDEAAAKKCAEQLTDFSKVELWEHARQVATFGSKSDRRTLTPASLLPIPLSVSSDISHSRLGAVGPPRRVRVSDATSIAPDFSAATIAPE